MNAPALLSLHGVSKQFGNLRVLEDVSFAVAPGERRGIIGPNGAGKSTLFNIIAGELPCTNGSVELRGRDVSGLPAHARARLGVARTFQTTTLFPRLSVLENLVLALLAGSPDRFQFLVSRRRYREREEKARELLSRVHLESRADLPADALGYGEKRQVEILLAIAQRPQLLLLDEPTAGLAPSDTTLVTEMLRADRSGTTMVLIEHDMSVVFDVVERLTVLHYGRVVADGPLDRVRADPTVQEIYLGGKL
ncbi:MAG: ABC transporter ATP-binding protein [Candidatus Eremiobacteraeota bacterium]|nr:ABC transporter ATP-binding protein [Candidatus Eremiobacteraeota bacterium]MBV8356139.1 ABC transporter ATP-binding protein [Candidatus Eremiobacteraeota bacterium]